VLEEYAYHPEAKCADATGAPSGRQTVGLHFPRHVVIEQVRYIGKEANELEDVEAGLVHAADESVYGIRRCAAGFLADRRPTGRAPGID
jgi:hypothetical protein